MIANLIKENRSCRRFIQDHKIDIQKLTSLVDLARMSASAANLQSLKYILSSDPDINNSIFSTLAWAAYLNNWPGPEQGERPSAYIIILGDTQISTNFWCDHGIAAQSILLGAREQGLAGCMIAAVNKPKLFKTLDVPKHLELLLVLAIGKPKENAVIDTISDNDIMYWRDENEVHHVPKRTLDEIIITKY